MTRNIRKQSKLQKYARILRNGQIQQNCKTQNKNYHKIRKI